MARRAAVTSGEGGSPKMKNLMNAPMRMTIESWPSSSPWVNDSEDSALSGMGAGIVILVMQLKCELHANLM